MLGAAAMSSQQDLAAASAPFDSSRGASSSTLAQDDEPRVITVLAKRYSFEPARVEVTEGERIKLVVSSDNGVHGVQIKKFKINKKVPRGGEVTIEFVASAAGEFPILCSEYCGDGHEDMKGMLVVAAKSARDR